MAVNLFYQEPGEIKQGYAGENIVITEFVQESISFPRFFHNDQLIAVLRGFDCDVSTNSRFYGRMRCSKDNDSNKTRIEIKYVTENDTGLYKVDINGSSTQRCFLNITDSASVLITVTPRDHFDEKNQHINITLSTNVLSRTVVNLERTQSELIYILPVTAVAVFAILLLFGSLIWIQRKNIKRFKAAQRIVLETMETASNGAFYSFGRSPHIHSRDEIFTSNGNSLENAFKNPISKISTSGNISCHNNPQQLDDDYYKFDVIDTILNLRESRSRSNETSLTECYENPVSLIDACSFPSDAFSATEDEEHLARRICNTNGQCQLTPNTVVTDAKVKMSSRYKVNADASCKDGYEMVDFSHNDNSSNGVQDVNLALATETPSPTRVGRVMKRNKP
ncbi:hypothetical protein ACJMK2_033190 [Sinanodonta woodiana]|uniref:Uncharacterized protein n=1 Tax=Sinanodonta woodiana TaxID=1069815 RepID=A0ABD3X412_SINWO